MAGKFNSTLHPRGPSGRFTKSFTKALTAAERKRATKARDAFHGTGFDAASLAQWKGTHSPQELDAIRRFADGDWKTVNADLRAGHDSANPDVAHLDAAAHPLPHDVDLHRTVPLSVLGGVDPQALSGRKVRDAGYASTSVHPPPDSGGAVLRMHIAAPAGTRAFPTGENGEVVLARDTDLVIESVQADGRGGYDMHLIVLPKGRTRASAKAPAAPAHPGGADLGDFAAAAKGDPGKTTTKLGGGMAADTSLVTLSDGRTAVHKKAPEWGDPQAPRTQADAENLAAQVAAALGVPTPAVVPDGPDAVWLSYIDGTVVGALPETAPDRRSQYEALLDGPDGIRLGLLDTLIVNADRNDGNTIFTVDGRMVAIDHGYAWELFDEGSPPSGVGGNVDDRPVRHFVHNGSDGNTWVDNPLTPSDVEHVRGQLQQLRSRFRGLGREVWLDRSLAMLDGLAKHATGTVSIYG